MANIETRTGDDGSPTFRVRIRLRGYPAVSQSFARKTDAKRWATQTEAAIREGRYFQAAEAKRHTLAEAIDRYSADFLDGRLKDAEGRRSQLAWWRRELGAFSLDELTPARIASARDKLAAGKTHLGGRRSPATVTRYLAALSHCLSVAMREFCWMEDNPLRRVTKPREPRGRVRFLDDNERARLLDAVKASTDPNLHALVVLALATGMRQGEAMGLTWADVDFDRSRAVLHDTKNGERRAVPLSRSAVAVLREHGKLRRLGVAFVFPSVRTNEPVFPRDAWERAVAAAEIENFRFHDLRHSTASYLAMHGASLMEIAEVLGHKTLAMVRRYAHLSEQHTRGVLERMNDAILGGTR